MSEDNYCEIERDFHKLGEKDLRQLCIEKEVATGSPAAVCKSFVEKFGMTDAKKILEKYREENHIDLVTSTYLDSEDFEKSSDGPVKFISIPKSCALNEDLECRILVDDDFVRNISRRDWIGIFEKDWKYLYSYWTFEWVTKVVKEDNNISVMKVIFSSKTLPTNIQEYVLCYVTRTGDVLGKSSSFQFKNPGLSFTDPDTFLVPTEHLDTSDLPTVEKSMVVLSNYSEEDKEKWDMELMDLNSKVSLQTNEIMSLKDTISSLQSELSAKTKGQTMMMDKYKIIIRDLEKNLSDIRIESQSYLAIKSNLEAQVESDKKVVKDQYTELTELKRKLADTELTLGELIGDNLKKETDSSSGMELQELKLKCDRLVRENASLTEQSLQSKKRSEAQLAEMKNEVNRKNVLLENKDDTISKLTMIKQESDSMACTLKSDAAKYKDDYKRLMNEMTSCIKRLESSENVQKNLEGENLKLIRKTNELKNATNENQTLKQTVQRLEDRVHSLEALKVSMGSDEDMNIGRVLSLQARIAHLEHLNSQLEFQKTARENDSQQGSSSGDKSGALRQQIVALETKLKNHIQEAELREEMFREGIKDLRGQLVNKSNDLEQKNELLSDKGELIDGLRTECQERREAERYLKHVNAQLEKKLLDESETFYQIIRDLQSQLNAFSSAHLQFDRNGLLKCPFCPAAYERMQQNLLAEHVSRKHP